MKKDLGDPIDLAEFLGLGEDEPEPEPEEKPQPGGVGEKSDEYGRTSYVFPNEGSAEPLGDAIERYKAAIEEKGMDCPLCDRWGKENARSLNVTMIKSPLWLIQMSGPDRKWVNVAESKAVAILRTKQLSTLKHWGFIERPPHVPDEKKHKGVWRPCLKGVAWSEDKIEVPLTVIIYNDEVVDWGQRRVRISDGCFKNFNYQEVMQTMSRIVRQRDGDGDDDE